MVTGDLNTSGTTASLPSLVSSTAMATSGLKHFRNTKSSLPSLASSTGMASTVLKNFRDYSIFTITSIIHSNGMTVLKHFRDYVSIVIITSIFNRNTIHVTETLQGLQHRYHH
ncbi:hypothetical protein RRG08_058896 [Elysia crispata]|uniref:Uncharacterized protein n=1 Tax=Elysia crispata TaxID=231223 RepID=A0AAE0YNC9_9GAST|nr:hypothetical protein RRG08_058896 [Elysia crispata]